MTPQETSVPRYSITFGAGSWEIPNLHCSAEATVINVCF
jgi:hypothetical protein